MKGLRDHLGHLDFLENLDESEQKVSYWGKPKTKTKEEKHISSWAICFNYDNDHNNNDYDNGGGNMTILPLNKMSWLKWELKKNIEQEKISICLQCQSFYAANGCNEEYS